MPRRERRPPEWLYDKEALAEMGRLQSISRQVWWLWMASRFGPMERLRVGSVDLVYGTVPWGAYTRACGYMLNRAVAEGSPPGAVDRLRETLGAEVTWLPESRLLIAHLPTGAEYSAHLHRILVDAPPTASPAGHLTRFVELLESMGFLEEEPAPREAIELFRELGVEL